MCNLVRRAPQNLEKVAKNPVEKIASNPVTSVAVMVFSALIKIFLVDVSDIFYFFLLGEGEKGESEAPGRGGGSVLLKIPRGGGGGSPGGAEGLRGSAANWGIFFWGGGG